MKDRYSQERNRGSVVVETVLVFPVVLLCTIAVLYIIILFYQTARAQMLADLIAERSAASWDNLSEDMATGKIYHIEDIKTNIYWRILDTEKNKKLDKIAAYAAISASKYNILKSSREIKTQMVDYIFYKKIIVNIEDSYKLPVSSLFRMFGINDCFTIKVKSESAIEDQEEFIRNVDFLIDIERELERKNPGVKKLGDKTRDAVDGVNKKISDFLK